MYFLFLSINQQVSGFTTIYLFQPLKDKTGILMTEQQNINYSRIAEAIEYIKTNFREQPGLDEVAKKVNLSPFHFQRLFSEWAGTSPKKFCNTQQ